MEDKKGSGIVEKLLLLMTAMFTKYGITPGNFRGIIIDIPLISAPSYLYCVVLNHSEPRVVFVFDIWHPDVKNIEKENINEMFKFAKSEGWL